MDCVLRPHSWEAVQLGSDTEPTQYPVSLCLSIIFILKEHFLLEYDS